MLEKFCYLSGLGKKQNLALQRLGKNRILPHKKLYLCLPESLHEKSLISLLFINPLSAIRRFGAVISAQLIRVQIQLPLAFEYHKKDNIDKNLLTGACSLVTF